MIFTGSVQATAIGGTETFENRLNGLQATSVESGRSFAPASVAVAPEQQAPSR
jgi:hypothetical protein